MKRGKEEDGSAGSRAGTDRNASGTPPSVITSDSLRLGATRCSPLVLGDPELHLPGELAERGFEYVSNPPQAAHGWIEYPSFQAADVRAVEAAIGAEAFLRMACLLAEIAHNDPDGSRLQIGRLDLPLTPLLGQIRWW